MRRKIDSIGGRFEEEFIADSWWTSRNVGSQHVGDFFDELSGCRPYYSAEVATPLHSLDGWWIFRIGSSVVIHIIATITASTLEAFKTPPAISRKSSGLHTAPRPPLRIAMRKRIALEGNLANSTNLSCGFSTPVFDSHCPSKMDRKLLLKNAPRMPDSLGDDAADVALLPSRLPVCRLRMKRSKPSRDGAHIPDPFAAREAPEIQMDKSGLLEPHSNATTPERESCLPDSLMFPDIPNNSVPPRRTGFALKPRPLARPQPFFLSTGATWDEIKRIGTDLWLVARNVQLTREHHGLMSSFCGSSSGELCSSCRCIFHIQ